MERLNRLQFSRSTIASAAIAGIVASTFAANVSAGPEPKSGPTVQLAAPFDWSGFYIGGNLGGMLSDYDFGRFETDVDVGQQYTEAFGPSMFTESGIATFFVPDRHETTDGSVIGGGQIGYQKQFGHFVIGVEGDFERTSSGATSVFTETASTDLIDAFPIFVLSGDSAFTSTRRVEMNWTASARGRIGYATGPLLFYGTGGVAWADITVWANDRVRTEFGDFGFDLPRSEGVIPFPFFSDDLGTLTHQNISRDDDTRMGWTAGGGVELAVSNAWTIGLEYRHSDFGSETANFNSHGGPIFPGSTKVDIASDQVTLRCNLLFSHFFGHQNYAGTAASRPGPDEDVSVAYTTADGGREKISGKDKDVVAEVEAPFNWTGIYLGGHIGGNWTDYEFGGFDQEIDLDEQFALGEFIETRPEGVVGRPSPPEFGFVSFNFPGSATGESSGGSFDAGSDASILGGGQLGYQRQFGRFVVGVEADFGGGTSGQSVDFAASALVSESSMDSGIVVDYAVTNVLARRSVDENWRASARARFGYAGGPGGRVLFYVTGGAVWSDVSVWATDSVSTDFFRETLILLGGTDQTGHFSESIRSKDDNVHCGWTAGGGADYAITKIASVGLEYRHNGFGDRTYHFDPHHSTILPGSTRVDLDSDQVTFRVNILLGNAGH